MPTFFSFLLFFSATLSSRASFLIKTVFHNDWRPLVRPTPHLTIMSLCENVTAVAAAPEGYDVDLCHPQQRAAIATYWCFGIGLVLSLLFTAQRLYVKLGIGTGWQVDDSRSAKASLLMPLQPVITEGKGYVRLLDLATSADCCRDFCSITGFGMGKLHAT